MKLFFFIKNQLKLKTFQLESAFVLIILCLTALIFGKEWHEWIAVIAVFYTFKHASVSNRLEEKEAQRKLLGEKVFVDCYHMAKKFFITKEILWFSYFAINGSYSALAGVIIFLIYNPWRNYYIKQRIKIKTNPNKNKYE